MYRRYGYLAMALLLAAVALVGFVRSDTADVVQDNVDIALNLIEEVWNKGNLDRVPDFYGNAVVWHSPSNSVAFGNRPCACAFRLLDNLREDFVGVRLSVENVIAQNDLVVAHYTFEGKPKGWMYDSFYYTDTSAAAPLMTIHEEAVQAAANAPTNMTTVWAYTMAHQYGVSLLPATTGISGPLDQYEAQFMEGPAAPAPPPARLQGEAWSGVLMYRFENSKVVEEWWYWDNQLVD